MEGEEWLDKIFSTLYLIDSNSTSISHPVNEEHEKMLILRNEYKHVVFLAFGKFQTFDSTLYFHETI